MTGGPAALVHRRRLAAQLLAGDPATTVEQVVDRLLAVQAQEPRGARLAVRARSTGLTAADVDVGLTDRRSLVVSWLHRGTLHLVRADDYWWLHPLTTPRLAVGSARRLAQVGVSPEQADRGVAVVREAVQGGPQSRGQLRARLDAAGVPTAGQALVHVLLATTLRTDLVRGPVVGGEQAFVSARQWLGPAPAPLDPDEALRRLARRYLAAHGPAGPADLARWAGVPLGAARRGLVGLGDEVEPHGDGLVDLRGRPAAPRLPAPRLLGAFDPLLLGWASREPVVGPHRHVVTSNGLFRPCALVGGRVVATWRWERGTVRLQLLEPCGADVVAALERDGQDVSRFLGTPALSAAG